MVSSRGAYIEYLQAAHGTMHEAWSFIDWELLESYGLPGIDEHRSVVTTWESDLLAVFEIPSSGSLPGKPSIQPTCGVSIGMLFALAEGARAARTTADIAARVLGRPSVSVETSGGIPQVLEATLRQSLVDWINGLELSQDDKDEALFAAKACVEFARRNFSNKSL